MSVSLQITGMTCASCVGRVEKALRKVEGVENAAVNLATETARIQGAAQTEALLAAVRRAGFEAEIKRAEPTAPTLSQKRSDEARALLLRFALAALFAFPVFVLEMGGHLWPPFHHWIAESIGQKTSWVLQFLFTSFVLFGPGFSFYRKGLSALLHLAPEMNTLVAVGTLAAYGYSSVATFAPQLLPAEAVHVYFEAAAIIVALVLLGRWLEANAKGRTSQAVQKLIGLRPKTALRKGPEGMQEVPIEAIAIGDVLEIRPGGRIPVDGVLLEGQAYIDESMISGEARPLLKREGDAVLAGTMNQSQPFALRTTAVGEETLLSQIIRMVEEAQGGKLPIQSRVDQITAVFVPIVFALALVTFGIWLWLGPNISSALVAAVGVLIIACPCAMGLATPTSVLVGTGRGAQNGILFRDGAALQRLEDVRVVAFDKTGTLTQGKPSLTDLKAVNGWEENALLRLCAAAESRSEHPLALALLGAAKAKGMALPPVQQMEAVVGFGVQADVEGKKILLGSAEFLTRLGIDCRLLETEALTFEKAQKSVIYAAINGKLAGIFAVSDPIKPFALEGLQALRARGIELCILSGDTERSARAVAEQLGIAHVYAPLKPAGKVEALRDLRARYGTVAFVGDGINDAPALAEADVGVAMGTGTDIAIEAGDVVLTGGQIKAVEEAIGLSKAVLRNIRQNLFWAFAYNAALIPVAAGALYPLWGILLSPAIGAGAMALSSLFVLSNALRLSKLRL